MTNRIYQGIRDERTGEAEVWILENTVRRTLMEQLWLLVEPLEFDWGYRGKGAKDLAIALLADALEDGEDPHVDELYKRLIEETICLLPAQGWQIRQSDLLDWVFGRLPRVPVHKLPLEALGGGVPASWN